MSDKNIPSPATSTEAKKKDSENKQNPDSGPSKKEKLSPPPVIPPAEHVSGTQTDVRAGLMNTLGVPEEQRSDFTRYRKPQHPFTSNNLLRTGVLALTVWNPLTMIPAITAYKAYDVLRKAPVVRTVDGAIRRVAKENVIEPVINTALATQDAIRTPVENIAKATTTRPAAWILGRVRDTLADFRNAIVQNVGLKDPEGNPIGLPGLALYATKKLVWNTAALPFRVLAASGKFIGEHPTASAVIGLGLLGAHMQPNGIPAVASQLVQYAIAALKRAAGIP